MSAQDETAARKKRIKKIMLTLAAVGGAGYVAHRTRSAWAPALRGYSAKLSGKLPGVKNPRISAPEDRRRGAAILAERLPSSARPKFVDEYMRLVDNPGQVGAYGHKLRRPSLSDMLLPAFAKPKLDNADITDLYVGDSGSLPSYAGIALKALSASSKQGK